MPRTRQPVFAFSGDRVFMLNSIAKVSHDLPPGAAAGIRRSCRRGVHDAVRDRAHHAPHPPPRRRGGRQDPVGCRLCLHGFFCARLAAGAALAHHVHRGAAEPHAQLARFGDGDLVHRRHAAHRLAPAGDRFIVLENGRRYEGLAGDAEYRVTEFDSYAARIETKEGGKPNPTHKTLPTWGLIENPSNVNLGELLWRVGIPISAMVLVMLAIPMSFVNPRAGRSINLLFALFTYIVYSNLLSVSQARVSQGRLDFGVGWWLVHAGMVLLLLFM